MTSSTQGNGVETPVLLSVDDRGIAHLTLNRPGVSNGLDVPLLKSLHESVLAIHGNPDVKVVLLSGNGKNFCAGGDVHTFAAKGKDLPNYLREATAWLQLVSSALIQLEVPVISVVQGFAAGGGGLGLVCASDFAIAADNANFMSGAVRVGMAPDAGVSVTLTQLVGFRSAAYILLANPIVSAKEGLAMGLLSKVVPPETLESEALAFAEQFLSMAPQGLAATKRLLWAGLGASVMERLPEEARVVSELSGTEDAREGLAAVIERRKPIFTGR